MQGKKTGGRKKGVPNKVTQMSKQVISDLLSDYSTSGLMSKDFMRLDPKDRMAIAERMMQYVMPKMQSVSADMDVHSGKKSLDDTLVELSQVPEKK